MEVKDIYKKYSDINGNISSSKIRKISIEEVEYLRSMLPNLPSSYTPVLLLQHVKYGIHDIGICKTCGKPTKWIKTGYQDYCCLLCMQQSETVKANRLKTNLKKYGVKSNLNIEEVKRVAKEKSHSKEALAKQFNTKFQKYGYETPFQSKISINKAIKNSHTELANESRIKTVLNKYGYEYANQSKEVKEKAQQTCLEKYGVNNFAKTDKFRKYMSDLANSKEFKDKRYKTLKENHTFNRSKSEEKLYNKLVNKYGKDDVIRQYKSDVYPFACDFYIKSKDLYIELQGTWTHGKHTFNLDSEEDKLILEQWKEKAKTSRFYQNAIDTWTIRDVNKRNKAKENNLNYKEFWSLEEAKKFIDDIYENLNKS